MKSLASVRLFALLVVAMLLLVACGGDNGGGETEDPATDPAEPQETEEPADGGDAEEPADGEQSDTEEPTAEGPPEGQESEFAVGFTSVGLSSVPLLAAIDELNAQGYSIDTPELAESELVTEGAAQGQFAFGSGANNATLLAIEQGAPLAWIVDRVQNEWTVWSKAELEGCEDLVASQVAVHSPGAVSTAMLDYWIDENCPPDTEFDPLIISGSDNRLAALLSDQVDATPLEFSDAIVLQQEAEEGEFHQQVTFREDLPELHPTSVYGNTDFMDANPDVTKALIRELLLQHRQINSEEGYLFELMQEYLPEEAEDEEAARQVTETYVAENLFADDGGLTEEGVQFTLDFFGPEGIGEVETQIPPEEAADLSYLQEVLDELGS